MGYYYAVYNKEIKIFLGIVFLVVAYLLIGMYMPIGSHVDNVKINTESGKLVFDDIQMESTKDYDYYQTYVYPNKFSLTCESADKNICLKIEKNQEMLKGYVVGFFGKDIKTAKLGKVEIETFLSENKNTKNTIKEIFATLYIGNQETIKNTGYEKYFEYKKTSENDAVILNSLETMCVTSIKNSIPIGSFDEENTIKQRVKNECQGYANISPIQIAFGGSSGDKDEIKLGLKITELKVSYKFFKKEEKEFKEKKREELLIPSNIGISDTVNLKDF